MNATATDAQIVNMTLVNISIEMSGGGQHDDVNVNFTGPDLSGHHVAPSHGLFLRNLYQSTINGLSLTFESNDDRPAIVLEHCENVLFKGQILMQRGRNISYDVGLRHSKEIIVPSSIRTCEYPYNDCVAPADYEYIG